MASEPERQCAQAGVQCQVIGVILEKTATKGQRFKLRPTRSIQSHRPGFKMSPWSQNQGEQTFKK